MTMCRNSSPAGPWICSRAPGTALRNVRSEIDARERKGI